MKTETHPQTPDEARPALEAGNERHLSAGRELV
jgi:hypothetical protein